MKLGAGAHSSATTPVAAYPRGMSVDDRGLSIAEMADRTGLSVDTLRWYEKEGILPPVGRDGVGRRRYGDRDRDMVQLLSALRTAGMSTADMKTFVRLLAEGAVSHGRRIGLLEGTQARLTERRRELDRAAAALDDKIAHYERLIAAGLDCDGAPVPPHVRPAQAARG